MSHDKDLPNRLIHCVVCDLIKRNLKAFEQVLEKLTKGESLYIDDPLGTSEWISRGGWGHQNALKITRDLDTEDGEKIHILELSKISQHTVDTYNEGNEGSSLENVEWIDEFVDWKFYLEFYTYSKKVKIEDCKELHRFYKKQFHENLDFIIAFIENQTGKNAIIPPLNTTYKINFVNDETDLQYLCVRE